MVIAVSPERLSPSVELGRIFNPTAELGGHRPDEPLRAFDYPDGHRGWLVSGHALTRTVLTDPRFSSRAELKRAPVHRPGAEPFFGRPTPPGWFIDLDPPGHTRFRRLLAGHFTAHRMNRLRPWIERIVGDCLDAMAQTTTPVDLIAGFALAVPLQSICELLGAPHSERDALKRNSTMLFSLEASARQGAAAMRELDDFFRDLVRHKRSNPADDLVSDLATGSDLTDEEVAGAGVLLLTAGHETVASMLGLAVLAMLIEPGQLGCLTGSPESIDAAIEELLRYLSILHFGVARGAREDVELAGRLIRAGDAVTVALPAANHDPGRFDAPDELDLTRNAKGHVAFGHGVHQCVGQNLARLELRVALPALFRRFPALALAVPAGEVALTRHAATYGVHRLPVVF
jgi:cytochrome P450